MKKVVFAFTCLLLTIPCYADIIIVDDDWPYDFNNIQDAIDYADWHGDIIVVFPGTYTGERNRNIWFGSKAITVRSVDPEDPYIVSITIIDCNSEGYGFRFDHGEDANSVLAGLTITNGYAPYGGGILCSWESSPIITNCTISGNMATDDGGGIYCEDESSPTITNCTISGNTAMDEGGGIFCRYSSPTLTNCIFSGNSAENGGGILNEGDNLTMTNCIFSGNSASNEGGGIYNEGVILNLTNCTFSGNSAVNEGGGIFDAFEFPMMQLINCILWGNTDSSGVGESAQITHNLEPEETPDVSFSCIQDNDPNDAYIPFGDANSENIDDDPMFVRDPNDGGDGWGVGDNDDFGDLHLQNNSPCINAGHPNFSAGPNNVDMDGQPRVIGLRVDMGADEFAPMIVVSKPQGGEVWTCESWHEIKWDSYGVSGTVDIFYSSNNGAGWVAIDSSVADTGSYMWHLPKRVYSEQCLVSIVPSVPDANVVCIESGVFTIQRYPKRPDVPPRWKFFKRKLSWWLKRKRPGPELGCVKWQFETDGPVSTSVAPRLSNRVHIACEDGKLYTLKKNDGTLLWSYDANSPLISSQTVGYYGMVYVGSEDGKLHAIDRHGRLLWTHTTDGFIYSSPAVSPDGRVYVCSQDGTLYALGQDGSELWSFETDGLGTSSGSILASPAIGTDGSVYIGGLYDPNLYALDPNDGDVKWSCNFEFPIDPWDPDSGIKTGWPFASPVVAADGTIYQTLVFDPHLYAIEPNTGTTIWSRRLTAHCNELDWFWPWGRGVPPEGLMEILEEECEDWFGIGIQEWVKYRYANCWSEPALGPDGTIYVSFDDPYLRAVDPNGSIKWVTRLGMMGGFTLTVGSDGLIYAASDDGHLCVVNAGGEELARFQSNDWLNFPVIAADNTIIVSGGKDDSMLIDDSNNMVWAIGGDGCQGQPFALHRPEDLDGNQIVNLVDFAILAADWLRLNCMDADAGLFPCEWSEWPCCEYPSNGAYFTGDVDKNLYVDFVDLGALAERWLSEE